MIMDMMSGSSLHDSAVLIPSGGSDFCIPFRGNVVYLMHLCVPLLVLILKVQLI